MSDISGNQSLQSDATAIAVPQSPIDKILQLFTSKLAKRLVEVSWITPNGITLFSLAIGGFLAAFLIIQHQYFWAVGAIIFSGLLDCLDGDLARARGVASDTGNLLDSVLDRYVDFFMISALILTSPDRNLIPGLIALLGAAMVPYIRAKSESLGRSSIASIGSRAVRTILIILGLLTGQIFPLLILLGAIANIAALHRFIHALGWGESQAQ
jgi:phosphatidylglycerophosphate synthase